MSFVNLIGKFQDVSITFEEKSLVNSTEISREDEIPKELINEIFNSISKEDFQYVAKSLRLVSKNCSKIVVDRVCREQASSLKNLLSFIQDNLDAAKDKELKTIEYCQAILSGKALFENISYLQVKVISKEIETKLIELLKVLERQSLLKIGQFCEKNEMPLAFKNLGQLLEYHSEVNKALLINDEYACFDALEVIIKKLIEQNKLSLALEVTCMIPINPEKTGYLNKIIDIYIAQGDLNQALVLTFKHPFKPEKTACFNKIIDKYIAQGDLHKALIITLWYPFEEEKTNSLNKIIKIYIAQGDLNKALELTWKHPFEKEIKHNFLEILKSFVAQEDTSKEFLLNEKQLSYYRRIEEKYSTLGLHEKIEIIKTGQSSKLKKRN